MENSFARDDRQKRVAAWVTATFGPDYQGTLSHRGLRLLEEAIELYQACAGDAHTAHLLIDHIFTKLPGKVHQEIGGVGTTLLSLAECAGISADQAEALELDRMLELPPGYFKKRDREKREAGFDLTGVKGMAGICFDIDGNRWHPQGSCEHCK